MISLITPSWLASIVGWLSTLESLFDGKTLQLESKSNEDKAITDYETLGQSLEVDLDEE